MGKRMNWDRAKKRPAHPVSESELDRRLERDANRFLARAEGSVAADGTKPWSNLKGGAQLEAFLGSRGIRTSLIGTTKYLIEVAARLFEVRPEDTPGAMAAKIDALGKGARARLFKKNAGAIMVEIGQTENRKPAAASRPDVASERGDGDTAKLLHQLVMAVINAGQAHIFAGCPEVIAHYGGRFPDADQFAEAIGISRDQVPLPDGRVLSYAIAGPARRVDA